MGRLCFAVITLVALFAFVCVTASREPKSIPFAPTHYDVDTVSNIGVSRIISYASFMGRPVQMVLTDHQTLIVRVCAYELSGELRTNQDATIDYLRTQVEHIVQAGRTIKLGDSGYHLRYDGGLPSWSPHMECYGSEGTFDAIEFAGASLTNNMLVARGTSDGRGYYPYHFVSLAKGAR